MNTNYFSENFQEYFFYVCYHGIVNDAKFCIFVAGKQLNSIKSTIGKTPLIFSILGGSFEISKQLIESGIDIFTKDNEGKNPLIHAIEFPKLDIVRLLLSSGCNPNVKDKHDKSAIDYCKEKVSSEDSIYSIILEEFNNWNIINN